MAAFSGTECLATVYPVGESWIGKSTTGEVRMFQGLSDYKQYLENLAKSGKVCPDVSVPVARPKEETRVTPFAGFLEFLPRNIAEQAKYSAMSSGWLGQEASVKAVEDGKFAEEEVYVYRPSDNKTGQLQPNSYSRKDRAFVA